MSGLDLRSTEEHASSAFLGSIFDAEKRMKTVKAKRNHEDKDREPIKAPLSRLSGNVIITCKTNKQQSTLN